MYTVFINKYSLKEVIDDGTVGGRHLYFVTFAVAHQHDAKELKSQEDKRKRKKKNRTLKIVANCKQTIHSFIQSSRWESMVYYNVLKISKIPAH